MSKICRITILEIGYNKKDNLVIASTGVKTNFYIGSNVLKLETSLTIINIMGIAENNLYCN